MSPSTGWVGSATNCKCSLRLEGKMSKTTQVVTATELFMFITQARRRARHTQVVTATEFAGTSLRKEEGG